MYRFSCGLISLSKQHVYHGLEVAGVEAREQLSSFCVQGVMRRLERGRLDRPAGPVGAPPWILRSPVAGVVA